MARNKEIPRDWFVCPHCGADVLRGAKACKECGSDAETGWAPGAQRHDENPDLPTGYGRERDFDYDDFLEHEFPQHMSPERRAKKRRWIALVLVVLAAFFLYALFLWGW